MKDSNNTRSRIIQCAATLIDKHGESAVRIRDLAEMVGISQPSLYHHFTNREAVLEAAHLYLFTTKQNEYAQGILRDTLKCTTQEQFREVLSNFFAFAHSSESQTIRETRITVMAGALRRPTLMREVKTSIGSLATTVGDALRVAQNNHWINEDLNIDAFIYWLLGELTVLVFIEATDNIHLRPHVSQLIRDAAFIHLRLPRDIDLMSHG